MSILGGEHRGARVLVAACAAALLAVRAPPVDAQQAAPDSAQAAAWSDRRNTASAYITLGLAHLDRGARDSARARVADGVAIFRTLADTSEPLGAAHYLRKGLQSYLSRDEGALISAMWYWRSAAFIYEVAGDEREAAATDAMAGDALLKARMPDSALAFYHRALATQVRLGDVPAQAKANGKIAALYMTFEAHDSARVYLRVELALRRQMHDSAGMGGVLVMIGVQYTRETAIDSALGAFGAALAIQRAAHDGGGEGTTLNNIGAVFMDIGRLDSALAYYRLALPLIHAAHDTAMEGSTLTNIGGVFHDQRQDDSALAYYRRGRALQHAGRDRANEAVSLGNIGSIFMNRRENDSALAYLHEAMAIHARNEGVIRSKIAQVYIDEGSLDSAFSYYESALALERHNGDRWNELLTLTDIAMLHQGALRGRKPFEQAPDLRSAVAYFDTASAVSAAIGADVGSDANRVVFAEQSAVLYENWALAWHGVMGEMDPGVAAQSGLAAVERGRSQALLQLMRGAPQGTETGKDLAAEGAALSEWAARNGVGVLSFYSTTDTLLLWLITPGGTAGTVFSRGLSRNRLAMLVAQLRSSLGVDGGSETVKLAQRDVELEPAGPGAEAGSPDEALQMLAGALLPIDLERRMRGVKEIVIVPHGPLSMVPFAALPLPGGQMMGETYALRFTPSLASLLEAERRKAAAGVAALVVGNPAMPTVTTVTGQRVPLKNLPGAASEGAWVAKRLGTTSLAGPAATESEVRRRLPRAKIVHLATHGYAYSSESMARESFIAFGPGAGNDGLLTVGEILDDPRLQLAAELVVLSGCQTGLGDLTQAEGTVGLQRAFLAKGARSVLVSLWSVSDDATALLMKRFYAHWLDDADHPDKAEALRRAQADVRARPAYRDPKYWAAFQLVGAR